MPDFTKRLHYTEVEAINLYEDHSDFVRESTNIVVGFWEFAVEQTPFQVKRQLSTDVWPCRIVERQDHGDNHAEKQ